MMIIRATSDAPKPVDTLTGVTEPAQEGNPPPNLNISITAEMMSGVWANFAAVRHSQYEFTLDFARVEWAEVPPGTPLPGIVVARVNLSPLLVSQLMDALQTNWDSYAAKALPKEVSHDADNTEHDDG